MGMNVRKDTDICASLYFIYAGKIHVIQLLKEYAFSV